MNLLIIGFGNIGRFVASRAGEWEDIKKIYVYDKKSDVLKAKPDRLGGKLCLVSALADCIDDVEVVLEAASQAAVWDYLPWLVSEGKHVVVMSVGAFLRSGFLDELLDIMKKNKTAGSVHVVSGAIGGVDAIFAASFANIEEAILTTTKNPISFKNNRYLAARGIDPAGIKTPTLIFEGSATDAVKHFPRNINVAATISLACRCKKVSVRIIADPATDKNIHEVVVRGEFGKIELRMENEPLPRNPRTSYIAALSALATIRKITARIKVGT